MPNEAEQVSDKSLYQSAKQEQDFQVQELHYIYVPQKSLIRMHDSAHLLLITHFPAPPSKAASSRYAGAAAVGSNSPATAVQNQRWLNLTCMHNILYYCFTKLAVLPVLIYGSVELMLGEDFS